MKPIRSVSDVRTEAHRRGEDRGAIRYSIAMALIGLAAVAVSALLPSGEVSTANGSAATDPATQRSVTPQPAPEPAEASSYPQRVIPLMGDKLEMAFY